ncbi:MAG TPA: hypothetical protein PK379_09275 [Candidatus Hydrogenedentes bacterium]|nr:DUF1450 domain-containing protein [Candidatus Hydrogenedentota bacterium]HOJ68596.1 hypothetical protein [Candidatus Hydrogenedentota bacterium]HOK90206.1 hypothetical protein [Candidatus Hydrogenedentota bacterium]HOV61177.1 hypothetical protein [Candidatus Hydrogenedentota bacterium]
METRALSDRPIVFGCYGKHCRKATKKIRKDLKETEDVQFIKTSCQKKCGKCPVFFLVDGTGGRFVLRATGDELKSLLKSK